MPLQAEHLALITLHGVDRSGVKRLSGFEKHHTVPLRVDDYHNTWIAQIASEELESSINDLAKQLRQHLNYKRKDITAGVDGNTAFLNTPTFGFRLTIALDPKSTAHVEWVREVTSISQDDIILDGDVSLLIGEHYQQTCFQALRPISIEELIDTFEENDAEVDYPHDCAWCSVPLPSIDGQVIVNPTGFTIEYGYPQAPHVLLGDLHDILPLSPEQFAHAFLEG
jgi:hypothetical protein